MTLQTTAKYMAHESCDHERDQNEPNDDREAKNAAASASLNYVTLTSLPKANPELLQKQFISNHSSSYPLLNSSNADTTQRRIMKLQEQGQERSMKFDNEMNKGRSENRERNLLVDSYGNF